MSCLCKTISTMKSIEASEIKSCQVSRCHTIFQQRSCSLSLPCNKMHITHAVVTKPLGRGGGGSCGVGGGKLAPTPKWMKIYAYTAQLDCFGVVLLYTASFRGCQGCILTVLKLCRLVKLHTTVSQV